MLIIVNLELYKNKTMLLIIVIPCFAFNYDIFKWFIISGSITTRVKDRHVNDLTSTLALTTFR